MNLKLTHVNVARALLAFFLGESATSLAEDAVPPFEIEASMAWTSLKSDGEPREWRGADVTFQYSNGWWQVEAKATTPEPQAAYKSCMKLAHGIRRYALFVGSDGGSTTDCPIAFPPPGDPELFVPWLALCPNPELPTIDSNRMHRFLLLPSCETELQNHPKNEGEYSVEDLEPGGAFLSKLSITNNGIKLDIGIHFGVFMDIQHFPAPFDAGFTDTTYEVLASTNIHGLAFPLKAVYREFAPKPAAKLKGELYLARLREIAVKRIVLSPKFLQAIPVAARLPLDSRPPNLPADRSVEYVVTNEHWEPFAPLSCRATLHAIYWAKAQWALESRQRNGELPTEDDLFGPSRYMAEQPQCPSGGSYTLGAAEAPPRCSIPGHVY